MRLGDVARTDLYGVLGVTAGASAAEIRRAYRHLAMASHPDLKPDDRASAERRMVELNVAASVLLDPSRRAAYDRARACPVRPPSSRWDFWWVSSAFRGTDEWARPETASPTHLEGELGEAVRRFRSAPSRVLHEWWLLTASRSPSAHAFVTIASVGLALVFISLARPRSLAPLFQQATARVANDATPSST